MNPSEDHEHDFLTRVRPLLVSAVFRRDTDALQRRGWFFEAIDQHQSGYRVLGHRDEPSIKWRLLADGGVHVHAIPGQLTIVPVEMMNDKMAERLVAEWWVEVMP